MLSMSLPLIHTVILCCCALLVYCSSGRVPLRWSASLLKGPRHLGEAAGGAEGRFGKGCLAWGAVKAAEGLDATAWLWWPACSGLLAMRR